MNNKGQTLVLFVIVLPIIFILFVFLLDVYNVYSEKVKLESIAKEAQIYLKENKEESLVRTYIMKNNNKYEIIKLEQDDIYIKYEVDSVFKTNLIFDFYKIEIHKKG